jgi:predicted translin family RNA/ssDNA-binding protein
MLDKKDLESIKSKIDAYEQQRDKVIRTSRDVVKLSKKVIYALHRKDMMSAGKAVSDMNKEFKKLVSVAKHPKLLSSGSYKVAVQEYVEAFCFYELMKNNRIPTNTKLKLDPEFYLMGLIDLTGELVRKSINSAIKGDYKTSVKLKELVSELYDELLLFDFAGGELRKKFDSIKYDLKKLDDLVLNLKLSKKIK